MSWPDVQETDGGWRLATLHYHHSQTHIVLHFPTTDEYEGLGGGYTFSNGLMRDGDGDPINHRPCGSGPLATQPTLAAATHTNRSAKPPRVAKQSGRNNLRRCGPSSNLRGHHGATGPQRPQGAMGAAASKKRQTPASQLAPPANTTLTMPVPARVPKHTPCQQGNFNADLGDASRVLPPKKRMRVAPASAP